MENLNQKSPEKLRQERINYLESQVKILGRQIEDIKETEGYRQAKETYDAQYKVLLDERNMVISFVHLKLRDKQDREEAEKEFSEKTKILKDVFAQSEPMLQIAGLKKQIEALEAEEKELKDGKSAEDENKFKENLVQLRQNAESLTEQVFDLLDSLEAEHLKPLVDLGMETSAALEVLRANDMLVYGKITGLRGNLSELDRVSEILDRIKNRYTHNASQDMDRVSQMIERIKNNL